MDTILRSGKIVYSQACWLLALTDFAALLIKVGREEDAQKLMTLTIETIQAVEEKLWSDNHGSYVDIQKNNDFEEPYRMLTQKQYEYHNQTFWPWISGIEMLARGRFNRIEECNIMVPQ